MIQKGAMGYLSKNSSRQEMTEAVLQIMAGKKYICREIKDIILDQRLNRNLDNGYNSLTERELEVISYLKNGDTSKEIANVLGLTAKTVEVHRYNILKKLKIKNTIALIHYMNSL